MNNNLYKDLKFKIFHSGNPVFFYIGINVLVFVIVSLISVGFFLSGTDPGIVSAVVRENLGFPAAFVKLAYRFYTIITYQFTHEGFFHLFFNMIWLYWMGNIFNDFTKARQFHFVYLGSGILGGIFYVAAYHTFPVFAPAIASANVIGSSAAVMGIVVATATLLPDFSIRMMFLGDVKLKYLAAAYILLSVIGIASANAGGNIAHIGGALFGFLYIKTLKNGSDWSDIFKKKPKLRVVKNDSFKKPAAKATAMVNQQEIDAILDKISTSGYDKLTREEKETLFKASNH